MNLQIAQSELEFFRKFGFRGEADVDSVEIFRRRAQDLCDDRLCRLGDAKRDAALRRRRRDELVEVLAVAVG